MSGDTDRGLMRQGAHPTIVPNHPGCAHMRTQIGTVLFERDVAVQLRDGITIYIDIFRPADGATVPVIIEWAPFGKHPNIDFDRFKGMDVDPRTLSVYTPWEALDPLVWAPRGYALIHVDPRGTWYSGGEATWLTRQEGEDEYDLIEWAGTQGWSNGRVGLTGVSYLSMSIWQAAALRPPHLAAIMPWEAMSDMYRDVAVIGGIPFVPNCEAWMTLTHHSVGLVEDVAAGVTAHPMFDSYWQAKVAVFEQIEVPAFIVCSWANHGLHTRGTLEAYARLGSVQKWLDLHGYKEWYYYYQPEAEQRKQTFLDHFLKDEQTDLASWPPVRLQIRDGYNSGEIRAEPAFPLARTRHTPYFLTAGATFSATPPDGTGTLRYDAETGSLTFDWRFDADTEITGHAKLRLWVAADGANDADLFVGLHKLDAAGERVGFAYYGMFDDGPVALGWLRVSHRELDAVKSRPDRPWHSHQREMLLGNNDPVAVEIEIWPASTSFKAGDGLRLTIQGRPLYSFGVPFGKPGPLRNRGAHIIHVGDGFDSHLLLPVIPGT